MNQENNDIWYSIDSNNRFLRTTSISNSKLQSQDTEILDKSKEAIIQVDEFIDNARVYTSITNIDTEDGHLIISFANGLTYDCGKVRGDKFIPVKTNAGIEYRYESESEDQLRLLVPIEDIFFKFEDLTDEQRDLLAFHFSDFTEDEITKLQQPALDAAEKALEAKSKIDTTEANVQAAESLRVTAESARVSSESKRDTNETKRASNESSRVTAESARVTSENTRVSSENTRKTNEESRKTNETTRQSQEATRQSNEGVRKTNETERVTNETARKSSEENRVTQENNRVNAETNRVTSENARKIAETARINAEDTRNTNEADRVAKELIRETQEAARQTNTSEAITAVNEAKTATQTATTNANTAYTNANTQANRAKKYADNPPKIQNNKWFVWDETKDAYVDTGVYSTGDAGKTPIIQNSTWWIYNNDTGKYEDTLKSVSSSYELTKKNIEAVFIGDIRTHEHSWIKNTANYNISGINNEWYRIIEFPDTTSTNFIISLSYVFAYHYTKPLTILLSSGYKSRNPYSSISLLSAIASPYWHKIRLVSVTDENNKTVGYLELYGDKTQIATASGTILHIGCITLNSNPSTNSNPPKPSEAPILYTTYTVGDAPDGSSILEMNVESGISSSNGIHATTLNGKAGNLFLSTDNTTPFTPTSDYNPATKKYVDDIVVNIGTILDNINGEVI